MKAISEKFKQIFPKFLQFVRSNLKLVIIVFLAVLLCISLIIQLNIQKKYSNAIAGITEKIFQKLESMEEIFSYVDDESVDVPYKLVPQLKAQYTAAVELNDALVSNFGNRYSVLSQYQIDSFDEAFKEYTDAISSGLSMNLARDDMAIILAEVQDMINLHYSSNVDPTATPVTITEG